jgi:Uma2 family endonuclease
VEELTMSTITQGEPTTVPGVAFYTPFRMSIDQYERLVGSGVFTKRDRLQLVDGILVAKMVQNLPHSVADLLCGKALARVIPPGWHLRPDKPVRLPPDGEPEPDQCVVRGEERDLSARHPGARDVGLLVEIADTSLAADRMMARTFSAGGIAVYWIVNLPESHIEVYTDPTPDGYATMRVYKAGDDVPVALDGAEVGRISVTDVLP